MKTPHSAFRTPHSGFTLVELLVVIAIIAALASMLVVAAAAAMNASREAAVKMETTQLAEGFDDYTNTVSGGSFPPNLAIPASGNPRDAFRRHFNKAFPSNREPADLIDVLAIGIRDSGTPNESGATLNGTPQQVGISPYEASVFWLGGFSDDPKYPISGPGGPSFLLAEGEDFGSRGGYDFEVTRLGPKAQTNQFDESLGRFITYNDPRTGNARRINLWWYYPPKLAIPYAYFDASNRPTVPLAYDQVGAIATLKVNPPAVPTVNDLRLANEGKCQILSAGMDDAWGNFVEVAVDWSQPTLPVDTALLYPDGPWTGDLADTITNFSTNRTLEDSQP